MSQFQLPRTSDETRPNKLKLLESRPNDTARLNLTVWIALVVTTY